MKISVLAELPDDETRRGFFRHLLAFDRAHPGCHFEMVADTQHLTTEEIKEEMEELGLTVLGEFKQE